MTTDVAADVCPRLRQALLHLFRDWHYAGRQQVACYLAEHDDRPLDVQALLDTCPRLYGSEAAAIYHLERLNGHTMSMAPIGAKPLPGQVENLGTEASHSTGPGS